MTKRTKKSDKTTITIEVANPEAARHFAVWLCESGEQDYWNWMEYREQEEEDDDITILSFHYHGPEDETKAHNDPNRYGGFMCDNIIRTEVGRMDRDRHYQEVDTSFTRTPYVEEMQDLDEEE
jgi:hypothetical protein